MVECILAKTLLVISGGEEAVPGINRAKEMGLFVIVSDRNPNAPGIQIADDYIIADTYNIQDNIDLALAYNKNIRRIDGVICIAADIPLTVASVAAALGLPGIPISAAQLASDKVIMKNRLGESGISIPWYQQIRSLNELEKIIQSRGYPLVLKPVDSRGARGVFVLEEGLEIANLFDKSIGYSPSKTLIVEEYIEGPQASTEGLIVDGELYPIGFADRNYEYLEKFSPNIIENGGSAPTSLSRENQESMELLALKAGLSLGVRDGVIKGDIVLASDGPKVIEVATRLSGGWFSTDQIPLCVGVDLVGLAIKLALGENILPSELKRNYLRGVAIRYFFPKPGIVSSIEYDENLINSDWIYKLHFFVKPGERISEVTNHTDRAGLVITTGETREKAIERAELIVNHVKFGYSKA
jgi:biotin carboxylase